MQGEPHGGRSKGLEARQDGRDVRDDPLLDADAGDEDVNPPRGAPTTRREGTGQKAL